MIKVNASNFGGQVRRMTSLLFVFVCCVGSMLAQPGGRNFKMTAEGTIVDAKTSEPLFAATVKVTSADGGTGTFGITDSIGHFQFDVERPGKYTLEFSYVGYKPVTKDVNIWPGRGAKLGTFKLEEDATYLKEVESVARSQRVKQVGDTIVYNADAYKVQDGATAEDLVAKMPGIEVTSDGVKAQGETVEKVLVDGKSFFENDPKLALKTLPAEVVQSVSVFDKKSDQSEFTGFDDGNTVKAMDLTTKSYRRNGVFGKVYGGIGNNFDLNNMYWNGGFNLNIFSGDRRISLLGMSNNVNQQNFSFDDLMSSGGMGGGFGRMAFRMGSRAGVSRANAFGLNFNDSYLDDKLTVQGSYFFNNLRTVYDNESKQDEINTDRSTISNTSNLSHNYSHRLDMRINYKPNDANEFVFRPSFNYQTSDQDGVSESQTWRAKLDSVLLWNDARRLDSLQNSSITATRTENTSWNAGGSLVWRHKFDTAGRTLSAEANATISGSDSETNNVKSGTVVKSGQNFLNSTSERTNLRAGGNVQYTEAIGEHSQLSARYNLNYSRSDNDNLQGWDSTAFSGMSDGYRTRIDSVDAANSSKYISKNLKHGGELAYRLRNDYVNMMASVNFEASLLDGEQNYIYWNPATMGDAPNYTTSQSYFSVLPRLRFEWNPVQGTSVNIDYRSSSSAPSISNLQQSVNTSNELAYSTGNKNLDQSVSHSVNVRFIHSNMEMATNIMFFGSYGFTQDYIGTQYITNNTSADLALVDLGWVKNLSDKDKEQYQNLTLRSGARFSRPVNMSGYRYANAGLTCGFPWDLVRSNVNLSLNTNYSVTPSLQLYYNSATDLTDVLDITTKVRNFSISPRAHITSNISQDLDFSLEYSPSFQKVKDANNQSNNYDYFTQTASGRINWTFWKNFTTEQQLTYTYYGGSSMPSVEDELVWNMSFGKKFLKQNKAEVKLQIYDVLNTRSGFSRSADDSKVTQSYTNYMPRYFMLTFSYKIANYKSSSAMKERQRSGFGGGFGGPRF
ncbi:MAG: outer membrane beta-barrel protein [Bacteroidales bacterium]|nr:outer membrane beta-barrel protein [Bacteroidales bacterium]